MLLPCIYCSMFGRCCAILYTSIIMMQIIYNTELYTYILNYIQAYQLIFIYNVYIYVLTLEMKPFNLNLLTFM